MNLGGKLEDSFGIILPSLCGTFGLSYYFNDTFGISFLCLQVILCV